MAGSAVQEAGSADTGSVRKSESLGGQRKSEISLRQTLPDDSRAALRLLRLVHGHGKRDAASNGNGNHRRSLLGGSRVHGRDHRRNRAHRHPAPLQLPATKLAA